LLRSCRLPHFRPEHENIQSFRPRIEASGQRNPSAWKSDFGQVRPTVDAVEWRQVQIVPDAEVRKSQMTRISEILPNHHQQCDARFIAVEESVLKGDWPAAAAAFERFSAQMKAHFEAEENILFPAFEEATGMSQGPTRVMAMEHRQMNSLLAQLGTACAARDREGFEGTAETLLVLMQQHNMKEENILYPMCDQALAEVAELGTRIEDRLAQADD